MAFKKHVCWDPALLRKVIDKEALQTDEHFFLATHHPITMSRVDKFDGERVFGSYTEREFLEEFLLPSKRHVNSYILGNTGTGKTHLIRWLHLHIPKTNERHIILIPKVGTNLKSIIGQILAGMEGAKFKKYQDRLERATSGLTSPRQVLLDNLCVAVGPDGEFSQEILSDRAADDDRQELINGLPALLHDHGFSQKLLCDGGIIDQLAQHVVGDLGLENRETSRQFTVDDLPLELWSLKEKDLTKDAREIYGDLYNYPDFRQTAVDWINKNLDWATHRMLDISGPDLNKLILDVRETLAKQGKELIILIEDFAKAEGIDKALLSALEVRPELEGRHLCVLRSAIALTTGYFRQYVISTSRARADIVVNLDRTLKSGAAKDSVSITLDEVAQFAARYLNAIRIKESELVDWHREAVQSLEGSPPPLPIYCDSCPERPVCHEGFKSSDSIGLYPFTPAALNTMYNRMVEDRAFDPRELVNEVIEHTLARHTSDIHGGSFPPTSLLTHFKGGRMGQLLADELRRKVSSADYDRYRTLHELWGQPERLGGIAPTIYEVFNLKPLEETTALPEVEESESPTEAESGLTPPTVELAPPPIDEVPDNIKSFKEELDQWANGGPLSQPLATRLRRQLFEALDTLIDWDAEMFVQEFYSGPSDPSGPRQGKPFRRESINFKRQQFQMGQASIRLSLPLNEDFSTVTIALQGALLHGHYGHWNFPDGHRYLLAYSECLHHMAEEVLKQVRQPEKEPESWDPVPVIVELLAIGAQMNGKPTVAENGDDRRLDALFQAWWSETATTDCHRVKSWTDLLSLYAKEGNDLLRVLKSRINCTKGRSMQLSAQIIDAASVLEPLRSIHASWRPSYSVPESIRSDYHVVKTVRQRVDRLLERAIQEEIQRYIEWCRLMRQHIASEDTVEDVIDKIITVSSEASSLGVWRSSQSPKHLEQTVLAFKKSRFEEHLSLLELISEDSEPKDCLPLLGDLEFCTTINAGSALVETVDAFLSATDTEVNAKIADLPGSEVDIEAIKNTINTDLEELCQMIAHISNDNAPLDEHKGK